ncbi:MAG TPA: hypothetical protein VHY35_01295 [Stellaceae bacterium]|jgi:hypothetical protein|nr:hypothetical protein [Stellaceae bacterium]
MSIFARKTDKRVSLESFKTRAGAVSVEQSIDKITGGTLANCHGQILKAAA